jgi:hypothetical protein
MLLKKYNSIMEQSEEHRNKWALGLTIVFSVIIFTSFVFYRGFINFGNGKIKSSTQMASVVSAKSVPSPLETSKGTLMAAFGEINKQYQEFKNSMANVLVPFISGIDVYERK